ncbi:hypothetical protein CMI44_02580 [Candidatus Pacearchaeota archaeon]|nr:hypothetical protein [Candidatus Pacearchaeota archaeon]
MEKKGWIHKNFTLLFVVLIISIFVLVFLTAYVGIEVSKVGVAAYAGTFNATEDTSYLFNFTVNNTYGSGAHLNVSEVNVSLPGYIVLELVNSNFTDKPATFVNSSGVLTWRNASGGATGFIITGNNSTAVFSFNATAATPGEYTINITVLHQNTTTYNFNVTVNDTTAPDVLLADFVTPVSSNYNHSGLLTINISITDNLKDGLGVSSVNISVYNISGVTTTLNLSNVTGNYWNGTLNTSTLVEGLFNLTVNVNDTTGNLNSTNITNLIFDQSVPQVVPGNFTSTTANNFNYSGTLVINVSVVDKTPSSSGAFSRINRVVFNITNITGQRSTVFASNPTGNVYNATIDTSQYPDGLYNITAWVNDTAGNLNKTAIITNVIFDNTKPSASISCTPVSVQTGDIVTCACSSADTTAGVNSTTFTAKPSTPNTGTFTQTCSVVDTAGNVNTAFSTYTVELSTSSGGGGGGSGAMSAFKYSKTIPQTSQEFSEIKKIETSSFSGGGLKAKERIKIKISNEDHFVGIRSMTETSAIIEIASNPVQIELDLGEDAKVDVNDDGYYDVYVKLNGITGGRADITIEYINELKSEDVEGTVETTGEDVTPVEGTPKSHRKKAGFYWIVGILGIAIIIWLIIRKKK